MTDLDDLIKGAWDLHCHCYPELSLEHRARQDDVEMVSAIASRGMAGVVLKSHLWPTPARACYLQRHVPGPPTTRLRHGDPVRAWCGTA